MAKEKVIEIKTGPAIKSVQDLKNNISAYKKELAGLDIGTKEYQDTLKALQENQAALRNAMHGTSASLQDVMSAATASNVAFDDNNKLVKAETISYNELVRELDILKQQWRATTDEAERTDLGKRINNVNDALKGMDESVGVFGRNVGNYIGAVDHLTAGLSSMGRGAAALVNPLKSVTVGFKTLSATPAVAVLGLLANILTKIIAELKSSEENTDKLSEAMAPLRAIGDAVTKVFQAMGQVIVGVVGFFGKLTSAIIGNNKAAAERLRLAKEQNALDDMARENVVENAKAERDVAELRAKATERDKYTASERLAFLQEAGEKEAAITERAKTEAEKRYKIYRDTLNLTKSSEEQMDKLAQLEADMVRAETAHYQAIRTINAGIVRARREEAKEARDAAKAVKDAATAKIAAEKEYLEQLLSITRDGSNSQLAIQNEIAARERDKAKADARQKITNEKELRRALLLIEKSYQVQIQKNQQEHDQKMLEEQALALRTRASQYKAGSVEYAQAMMEAAELERDQMRKRMDESEAQYKARQTEARRSAIEAQQALNDAILRETVDGLNKQMTATREGSVEQLELALQIEREKLDGLYQGLDESLDQYNTRRLEQERAVRQAEDALADGRLVKDRTILEQRMAALKDGSVQYLEAAMELKKFELDSLHQLEGESNDAFRLRQLEAEKEYNEAQKALVQERVNTFSTYSSAVSGLFSGLADLYEANTEDNKEAAESAKNLRIASAIIDTISGAISAYVSGIKSNIPAPGNMILGATQAATITAAGLANIAKMRATTVSTTSATSATSTAPAAVVEPPAITPQMDQVRTITGASEEERLNQMASPQRVYILDSDLQARADQRKVEVEETTW